jgi:hypothetical protein
MDQTPTAPVPPFGPPELPPDTTSAGAVDSEWTPTVPLPEAPIVLPSAPPTGAFAVAAYRLQDWWHAIESRARTFGWSVAVSVPIGLVVSLVIGIMPAIAGDREFWDGELHFVLGYWYIVAAVIAAIVPVVFIALRDGRNHAVALVVDRRYWRVLVAAAVLFPMAVAVIVFVASHLLAVLLTIIVVVTLLILAIMFGGGF